MANTPKHSVSVAGIVELFRRHGNDFYKIDPLLFSPAEIAITNSASGRTFRAGGVNVSVLRASLFE